MVSNVQNEVLSNTCKTGDVSACKQLLKDAAWYANQGIPEEGFFSEGFNKQTAQKERNTTAKVFADTVYGKDFKKENYVSIFDTLSARRNLFGVTDQAMKLKGHEVEWFEKAEGISGGNPVKNLLFANGQGFLDYAVPDNKKWISEAGKVILNVGYSGFKDLYNIDNSVKGRNAKKWDRQWLTREQNSLQYVHEKYIKHNSISDWQNSFIINNGFGDRSFLNAKDRIDYGIEEMSNDKK